MCSRRNGVLTFMYSVLEMQTFLVALVSNFEFSSPDNAKRIIRHRSGSIVPMVEGEAHMGSQLPLKVSYVSRD